MGPTNVDTRQGTGYESMDGVDLVVAHRMHTVLNAHQLLVTDIGRIERQQIYDSLVAVQRFSASI